MSEVRWGAVGFALGLLTGLRIGRKLGKRPGPQQSADEVVADTRHALVEPRPEASLPLHDLSSVTEVGRGADQPAETPSCDPKASIVEEEAATVNPSGD